MDRICENILDITNNYYEQLMNLENVHGIGLGHKYIQGIDTSIPCIHVLVEKKVDSKYLTQNNLIPKEYMGIMTDVIESKRARAQGLLDQSNVAIPGKTRPLEAGAGISVKGFLNDGTIGCIVKGKRFFKEKYFILSNNHILARNKEVPIGTPIIQPSFYTGGSEEHNIVARLSSFIPIKFIKNPNKKMPVNYVDCAIAQIYNPYDLGEKIYGLGSIMGANNNIGVNDKVKKVGFISGLTVGEIISIGNSIIVNFPNEKKALFQNQIKARLTNYLGDSGATVLNDKNEAVGLLFAGIGDEESLINPIDMVLKKLKVEIYKL